MNPILKLVQQVKDAEGITLAAVIEKVEQIRISDLKTKDDVKKVAQALVQLKKEVQAIPLDKEVKKLLQSISDAEKRISSAHSKEIKRLDKKIDTSVANLRQEIDDKIPDVVTITERVNEIEKGLTDEDYQTILDKVFSEKEKVRDALEDLEGDERLDASAIKNLPQLQTLSAGGGSNLSVFSDGAFVGSSTRINFTGATVTNEGGRVKVAVTGGSGISDGDKGDVTVASSGAAWTVTGIQDEPVADADSSDGDILVYRTASNSWVREAKPAGDSNPAWGDITGTLSNQTDLQAALDAKAASSHTHVLSEITDSGALAALNTVGTAQIDNDAVTFDKIQNVNTNKLIGRDTAGTGSVEEISVGTGLEFSGASAIQVTNYNNLLAAGDNVSDLTNDAGYLTSYTETDPVVGAVNGLVKANGAGTISAAVADTDYLTPGTAASTYQPTGTYPDITSGAGAPASTPSKVGDIYIDTTGDDAYIAVGTASSADWEKSNDGGGAGGGDAWSDPVDADILPDTDSTRDIGTDINRFAEIYGDNVYGAEFRAYDSVYFRDQTTSAILFGSTGAPSAVNYLDALNAATGSAPILAASGTDTNISLNLVPKGTGEAQVAGEKIIDESDIGSTVQAHSSVLDATTASFTTADETKLDGIEAGADVTDTANVTAAGALMDSEVDADIKTLSLPANTTISTFGASLVDDADAAAARTTLGAYGANDDPTFDLITYDAARGKVTAGGNLGATETINFNDETNYTGTLDSNITFTFANATSGDDVTLYLSYDGTAQRTITWPTVTWLDNASGAAPATPSASGNVLVVTIRYVGTTYYASATGNYAVYS